MFLEMQRWEQLAPSKTISKDKRFHLKWPHLADYTAWIGQEGTLKK